MDSFTGEDSQIHRSALVLLDDDGGLVLRHTHGVCCAKAYSIKIRAISPKNLLGPPYVRYAFLEIEYISKYSLRVVSRHHVLHHA